MNHSQAHAQAHAQAHVILISPNGTTVRITKQSYNLLTIKGKERFQLIEPALKVEIPDEVVELLHSEEEPTGEVTGEGEKVKQPELDIPKDTSEAQITIEDIKPGIHGILTPLAPVKKKNKLTEMSDWRRELRDKDIRVDPKLKYDDLKQLYESHIIPQTPKPKNPRKNSRVSQSQLNRT